MSSEKVGVKNPPGEGRRWRLINEGKEPFSGTNLEMTLISDAYGAAGLGVGSPQPNPADVIAHPERHVKGGTKE
ncbi:MAG: hypothetical protein A2288_03385 [Candidatus Moranbacteria bacterium RIFOXYA12_FULL_44_15]|nr:MAG: hypothetical protein A2288_03385 [Candidatus Moranbacteria bacterium RIFOXYA12_FULL_44_15]